MKPSKATIVCFGEMLWDVLPNGRQAGGAPFNEATHLRQFGQNVSLLSKIGSDDLGEEILAFAKKKGLSPQWIQKDPHHLTGVVQANIDDRNEVEYQIKQPVAWDFIQVSPDLVTLVEEADYFIYGSLIARQAPSQTSLFRLLESAQYKIFDVNLRAPHYTPESIRHLLAEADLVKMNHHELAEVCDWFRPLQDTRERMEFLKDRFELDKICVSLGEKGACLLSQNEYIEQPAFKIKVLDTIGSGDAFLAAFIHQLIEKAPLSEALAFACATGAYVATQSGATPSLNQDFILNFMNRHAEQ